jgi:ribose transport system permease protein
MSHEQTPASSNTQGNVAIESVLGIQEKTILQSMFASQAFWVTVSLFLICGFMTWYEPHFGSLENLYNITRNFAFIGIMALGMTVVIITGGIDLSVGSIMGVVAVASGLVLEAEYPWWLAVIAGLGAGLICGLVSGYFVAYLNLSPFVVTLGMLSIARSFAIVLSGNRMIYNFGPGGPTFKFIGGGSVLGIANPVWFMVILAIILALVLRMSVWGRHLMAIGGNEHAAVLTGVPVRAVKLQAYAISALAAAFAAVLNVGWSGSAINALGQSYELRAIASTVIGGANLMGGEGGAYGAVIGSALIEVIRNALLMAGVDSNWQGTFVGSFIVLAVLLEKIRGKRRE